MAATWISDLVGTIKAKFQIGGKTGVNLKNSSGNLLVRNAADSADSELTASKVNVSGNDVVINSDAAGSGNDWKLTLRRSGTQTEEIVVIFPENDGTDGYYLRKKAGGAAGEIPIEFVAPPSGASGADLTDTTSLAFGSSSPVTMFTTSATAVVKEIEVVIDTAFDGTPTMSVGIAGTTSKYMASTDNDLTAAATTSFIVHPNLPAQGAESLIITYSAGGATAGAARVLVTYVEPV